MKQKLPLKFIRLLLVVLMTCLANLASAQDKTISGTVLDETGQPLPGVSIVIKGTSTGTTTSLDGNYKLNVPADAASLVFSFIGYKTLEREIGNQTKIDVNMELDTEQLEEVVVVGYGVVKKSDNTGSVALATEKDFNKGFQTSPEQLIQGRISGVQITSNSGAPGAGASIRIRGNSSIRGGNDPLIVLDGVPLDGRNVSAGADIGAGRSSSTNPLNFINPNDIESMSVLKDASATAIYGSRGANGVIIITTKKGARNKPTLNYSASFGSNWVPDNRKYDLLSADAFRAATNNPDVDFGGNIDPFDEITRVGAVQNHTLAYGGSNDKGGSYRFSLNYQNQEGVIKNTGLEKVTGSVNLGHKAFNDKVRINASVITSLIKDQTTALSENVGAEGDLMTSTLRWNPTRPFKRPDGTLDQISDNQRNPLAFLELYSDDTETSRIFANLSAAVDIIEGLEYKVNVGIDRSESERGVALSRQFLANFNPGGIANIENVNASSYLIEHTLNYNKSFSENVKMNLLAGYSFQEFFRRGTNQRGTNFVEGFNDQNFYLRNLNAATSFPAPNNTSFQDPDDMLQSFFGRVNVDLYNKFLLTATVRADGSSRFGENNQYGVFPSMAFAWKLIEEDFVPDVFSDLKVRAGWGITGNRELPPGRTRNQFQPDGQGGENQVLGGNEGLS